MPRPRAKLLGIAQFIDWQMRFLSPGWNDALGEIFCRPYLFAPKRIFEWATKDVERQILAPLLKKWAKDRASNPYAKKMRIAYNMRYMDTRFQKEARYEHCWMEWVGLSMDDIASDRRDLWVLIGEILEVVPRRKNFGWRPWQARHVARRKIRSTYWTRADWASTFELLHAQVVEIARCSQGLAGVRKGNNWLVQHIVPQILDGDSPFVETYFERRARRERAPKRDLRQTQFAFLRTLNK